MKFLALDTCTEACSAALVIDDEVVGELQVVGNRHSQVILDMVSRLLAAAQLSLRQLHAVGFTRGPGSFTGVRIGTGVVQGLAYAADLPVLPVSSLALLAQGVDELRAGEHILPLLDARMGEVYWSLYAADASGTLQAAQPERLSPLAALISTAPTSCRVRGPGLQTYRQDLAAQLPAGVCLEAQAAYPDARHMAPLLAAAWAGGAAVAPGEVLPLYLRNDVAWPKARPVPTP